MKKLTRNVIIMAVVTVIMAVVLGLYIKYTGTVPAADNAASLTDGIYTSSAQGCLSDVTVTVTVTGGRVTGGVLMALMGYVIGTAGGLITANIMALLA